MYSVAQAVELVRARGNLIDPFVDVPCQELAVGVVHRKVKVSLHAACLENLDPLRLKDSHGIDKVPAQER